MKMELSGVLKETLLQRNLEAKEMVERFASNYVPIRKIRLEF
jgi:hypothetical protein